MKMKKLYYFFLLILGLLINSVSNAALIDLDWKAPGDAALMQDTVTGLTWLDLNVTANQSYNEVSFQLQQDGMYSGFRYANYVEVLSLWGSAGISNTNFTWVNNGEWQQVKGLADRLGTSTLFESTGVAQHALGMVNSGLGFDANQRRVLELSYQPNGNQVRTSTTNYVLDADFSSVHYSSYLVKAVPLPGAFWFMLSGIVGLLSFLKIKKGA